MLHLTDPTLLILGPLPLPFFRSPALTQAYQQFSFTLFQSDVKKKKKSGRHWDESSVDKEFAKREPKFELSEPT